MTIPIYTGEFLTAAKKGGECFGAFVADWFLFSCAVALVVQIIRYTTEMKQKSIQLPHPK
jgi:hypothetical protein